MRYKIIDVIVGQTLEFDNYDEFTSFLFAILYGLPKRVETVVEEGFICVFKISFAE